MTRRALAAAAALIALNAAPARAAGEGAIAGTVSAASGRVCVYVLDASGQTVAAGPTNDDGSYVLDDVPAGSWTVEFYPDQGCVNAATGDALQFYDGASTRYAAAGVTVTDGQTTSAIDGTLPQAAAITGIVRDRRGPLPGVCVILEDAQGRAVVRDGSADSGQYRLDNLPPGVFLVQFVDDGCTGSPQAHAPQYYSGAASIDRATKVTLRAGRTTALDDVLLDDATAGPPPAPSPAAPAPPGASGVSAPAQRRALLSVVGRLRVDRRRRLHVGVACARGGLACRGSARLVVALGHGRHLVVSHAFALRPGHRRTLLLSLRGIRATRGRLTVRLRGATRPALSTAVRLRHGRLRP